MGGIKAFLILAMASFHFSIVSRRVRPDELMTYAELLCGGFKQSRQFPLCIGKTVGKLKAIICLHTLHLNSPASKSLYQLTQEICRGISGLFGVGSRKTQPSKLINGGVLEQAQFRIGDAAVGNYFNIDLNALAGIGHLFIRFRRVRFLRFWRRKHSQPSHDAKQAFRTAGISPLLGRCTNSHSPYSCCFLLFNNVKSNNHL